MYILTTLASPKLPFKVQWNQVVKIHMDIAPRIEKVLKTNWSVLKCWDHILKNGWMEETVLHQNNGAWLVGWLVLSMGWFSSTNILYTCAG